MSKAKGSKKKKTRKEDEWTAEEEAEWQKQWADEMEAEEKRAATERKAKQRKDAKDELAALELERLRLDDRKKQLEALADDDEVEVVEPTPAAPSLATQPAWESREADEASDEAEEEEVDSVTARQLAEELAEAEEKKRMRKKKEDAIPAVPSGALTPAEKKALKAAEDYYEAEKVKKRDGKDAEYGEEDFDKKQKLVPPQKKFSGEDGAEDIDAVLRGWRMWKEKYPLKTDRALGRELMEAVTGRAEKLVYQQISEGNETYSAVYALIAKKFGWKKIVRTTKVEMTYEAFSRGNMKMREFLEQNDALKAEAEQHEHQDCPRTAGLKLLRKANLAPEKFATVLRECMTSF